MLSEVKNKKCHNCKSNDHITRECMEPKKRVESNCRNCGSSEHRGNKCPNKINKIYGNLKLFFNVPPCLLIQLRLNFLSPHLQFQTLQRF